MMNYVTGYEYSGVNAATLAAVGVDAVVTFKQAVKELGVSGKKLKGLKSCATLVRFSKNEKVEDEEGKTVPKPIYFSVFDANEVLKRK
jgi:antirestriction protein ArdC